MAPDYTVLQILVQIVRSFPSRAPIPGDTVEFASADSTAPCIYCIRCFKKCTVHLSAERVTQKPDERTRIAKTLGVQVSSKDEEPLLLPPRVSLEHAEASVRKTAMQQLVEQQNNDDSLLSAFLRHLYLSWRRRLKWYGWSCKSCNSSFLATQC